jgi:hypothetical protein
MLDGAAVDGEVGGDVLVLAARVGEQDVLEAVADLTILRGAELGFQALGLALG